MRKVVYFYNCKNKYYASYPIINNFAILKDYEKIFKSYKIELIRFLNYDNKKDSPLLLDISYEEMLELLNKCMNILLDDIDKNPYFYKKMILLFFHPVCLDIYFNFKDKIDLLRKKLGLKIIFWQDDLHFYFKNKMRGEKLENLDKIITPSPIYFKNVNCKLYNKTKFFFYSCNFEKINEYNIKWEDREERILLSGCCNRGYPLRHKLMKYIKKNRPDYLSFLKRPKINKFNCSAGKNIPIGLNYYEKLSKYKGAVFGYYQYPKNFNLAKIIEILACGCIGFFEYSPLLEEELGLKSGVHYINILDENGKLILDDVFYKKWLKDGKKIAENGKNYVEQHFSNTNGFKNYVKILKKL